MLYTFTTKSRQAFYIRFDYKKVFFIYNLRLPKSAEL